MNQFVGISWVSSERDAEKSDEAKKKSRGFHRTSPPFDQQPAHCTPDVKARKAVRRSAADWVDFKPAHARDQKPLITPWQIRYDYRKSRLRNLNPEVMSTKSASANTMPIELIIAASVTEPPPWICH
ncbi:MULTISPECIES: hypothetical protein [Rhizobium]|uniref:hypothetical protein n=1 Tax=Rhizobium TaxID=379 RepID=UPI001FEF8330|nr:MULTISPECIES: hypothetical protein [Rhizobium]